MPFFILFVLQFSSWGNSQKANSPVIRILLAKNIHSIKIQGPNLGHEQFAPNGHLVVHLGVKNPTLCKSNLKVYRPGQLISRIKSKNGNLHWKNKYYSGELAIYKSTFGKRCDLVNIASLEQYLEWLIAKEMNTNWPLEALKAQAITARSYALYKIENTLLRPQQYYDLENSEKDQVSGHIGDQTSVTAMAINQTKGLVLLSPTSNKITPGFFHSKCGGNTLTPENVWKAKVQGFVSVPCPYCHELGLGSWSYYSAKNSFLSLMKKFFPSKNIRDFFKAQLIPDNKNFSMIKLSMPNNNIIPFKKSVIRSIIGRDKIPSNRYKIELKGSQFVIQGVGNGHGVGLCQFGAKGMAMKGHQALEIIEHYFPKLKIRRHY